MKMYLNLIECVIEYREKFLAIQIPEDVHAAEMLSSSGGKIDDQAELTASDILKTGVKREILEEVGTTLTDLLRYTGTTYFMRQSRVPALSTLFHCVFKEGPIVIPSPREVSAYFWMTREEINVSTKSPSWLKDSLKGILDD